MTKLTVNFKGDGNKITVSLKEMEKVCVFSESNVRGIAESTTYR
jgi:hypothetical protein